MTNLTIRIDDVDKSNFADICDRIGLSVTAAFNVFVKAVIREQGIPFELSAKNNDEGFYSKANIEYLENLKKLDDEGKLHFISKTQEELEAMER